MEDTPRSNRMPSAAPVANPPVARSSAAAIFLHPTRTPHHTWLSPSGCILHTS